DARDRRLDAPGAAAAGAAVRAGRRGDADSLRVAGETRVRAAEAGEGPERRSPSLAGAAHAVRTRRVARLAGVGSARARVDVGGDVVGALVEMDDAVVRVRVLREGGPVVEEA